MIKNILLSVLLAFVVTPAFSQSGCCSWHGGVDYCGADGHVYCRDGQQSPSCMCNNYEKESDRSLKKPSLKEDLFTLKDMGNPNPYLNPVAAKWLKKNT